MPETSLTIMGKLSQPDALLKLAAIALLIIISAFFSGSETALTAASRSRIHAMAKDGSKRARTVDTLLETRERLIGALLLGNNLVNILASTLMAGLMLDLFGAKGMIYATIIMTALVLVFAEVLPKTYAITKPDSAALSVARPVSIIVWLFAPIVSVVQIMVSGILKLCGVSSDAGLWTTADEIRGAVNFHSSEGRVEKSERDRILGVLTIGDLIVEDVMIHRKNLIVVDADLPSADIIKQVLVSGHTRLPLWKDEPENVVGILHTKDLLQAMSKAGGDYSKINFSKITRKPWFVPETTTVVTQLRAFQQKRAHFALTVDEYGALMGVVTLEDILEEIVGDINDEFDQPVQGVKPQKDGSFLVAGDVPVRDLNRFCDWDLPDEDAVTIAGLVIHESRTIPDVGRVFSFYGHRFEIMARLRNQITSIKITRAEQESAGDTA